MASPMNRQVRMVIAQCNNAVHATHLKSMGGRHISYEEYMRILYEMPVP